jgi:TonB family protein
MTGRIAGFGLLAVVAGGYVACAAAHGQSAQNSPEQLKDLLLSVRQGFGLQPQNAGPFHLKAHFNTFDSEGKPDGSGTLEEYWDGKERLRREFVYRGKTQTTWRTPAEYRSGQQIHPAYYMRRLVEGFESAIPPAIVLEGRTFSDRHESLGNVPMHCILTRNKLAPMQPNSPPETVYGPMDEQAFCLSSGDHFLRVLQSYPGVAVVYNQLRGFGKQTVPFRVSLTQGSVDHGEFVVDTLEDWTPEDAIFVPAADAKQNIRPETTPVRVSSGVIAGSIIDKRQPVYPSMAKAQRLQGLVILAALITKQGTIDDLEVLASPGASLSEAAVDAVKDWRYRPYVFNGEPVEVDTTVTVSFAFATPPGH